MLDETLPAGITRPIYLTAMAILGFLALFLIWSALAPLTTTLQLTGKIKSSRPTIALQHPYGGLIGDVMVSQHDKVVAGQILLKMDMSLEKEQLRSLEETRSVFLFDNKVIATLLARETGDQISEEDRNSQYFQRVQQATIQNAIQRQNAQQITEQSQALKAKIALTRQQLQLMQSRHERQTNLAREGLIKRSEGELLEEQILMVRSEIEEDRASLSSLQGQIETAHRQAKLALVSMREQLIAARDANFRQLQDINRQIAGLKDQIDQSVVRSPVDAIVTEIGYEAKGMFAARGATLLSLTEGLDQPLVSFSLPSSQIDQLAVGMKGRLILTSLPQREMPKIDLSITAISPRARVDENGAPIAYSGIAEIDTHSLEELRTVMKGMRLSEDMPVQLLVSAGETTLLQYLLAPVSSAFRTAFQD